jgi:hypothetical protein
MPMRASKDEAMTKVELTEALTLWSGGAHTVTTIEVQAVKLWAKLAQGLVTQVPDKPGYQELAHRDGKMIAGFLSGIIRSTDEDLAQQLLLAKEEALQAGDPPISAEPIPQ